MNDLRVKEVRKSMGGTKLEFEVSSPTETGQTLTIDIRNTFMRGKNIEIVIDYEKQLELDDVVFISCQSSAA